MKYIWERKNWFNFEYDEAVLLMPLSRLRVLQGKLLEIPGTHYIIPEKQR